MRAYTFRGIIFRFTKARKVQHALRFSRRECKYMRILMLTLNGYFTSVHIGTTVFCPPWAYCSAWKQQAAFTTNSLCLLYLALHNVNTTRYVCAVAGYERVQIFSNNKQYTILVCMYSTRVLMKFHGKKSETLLDRAATHGNSSMIRSCSKSFLHLSLIHI